MDLTASYRTKAPPKEHEEAVRMLLESIANKRQVPTTIKGAGSTQKGATRREAMNNITNSDRGSLKTNSSSSAASNYSSYKPPANIINNNNTIPLTKCKTTSTNEDTISTKTSSSFESKSTSAEETFDAYREPIPSRTIAVQCDLKLSSVKRADANLFDASMQASSISSTKYGFYNFSQEFLDRKRKSQQQQLQEQAESNNNYNKQQENGLNLNQMEAPTSMSELSSSSSSLNLGRQPPQRQQYKSEGFINSSNLNHRDTLQTFESTRGPKGTSSKGGLSHLEGNPQVARARLDSLPRRPMTALSYVSSSHLRDTGNLPNDHESSCDEMTTINQPRPIKSHRRAHSQQVLSGPLHSSSTSIKPRLGKRTTNSSININNNANGCTSSESDCSDCEIENNHHLTEQLRVPHSEEVLLTKRGQSLPASKQQRPVLLKSSHNEQVEELNLNSTDAELNRTLARSANPLNERTRRTNSGQQRDYRPEVEENFDSYENSQDEYEQRVSKLSKRLVDNYSDTQPSATSNGLDRRFNVKSRSMYSKNPLGSMSLSRKPKAQQEIYYYRERYNNPSESQGFLPGRRSQTLTRSGLVNSQQTLPTRNTMNFSRTPHMDESRSRRETPSSRAEYNDLEPVTRSTSMRHINPEGYEEEEFLESEVNLNLESDATSAKTWANPSAGNDISGYRRRHRGQPERMNGVSYEKDIRKGGRLYNSTRNNHHPNVMERDSNSNLMKSNGLYNYNYRYHDEDTQSTTSSSLEQAQSYVKSQPLDYDSQHRLNESGLPEVHPANHSGSRRPSAPSSFIGLPTIHNNNGSLSSSKNDVNQFSAYTVGRPPKITGRAMSQQSLTRPTMPGLLTGRRRRRAGSSNSGSDVGGSSMSLVSRLNGRYENAHTRTPVIMYIPQVPPKPATSSSSLIVGDKSSRSSFLGKSSTLRKSMKSSPLSLSKFSSSKSSSQDKLKRANGSRNGSDSESSSMLRTLVKPRGNRTGSRRGVPSSRLQGNRQEYFDNEDEDGVGQLMTEMDGYKFKRRYSVPKDAKINWFAKLKQKVSSSGAK